MTVKITKEAKKWLTVAQMPVVNQIIAQAKEDDLKEAVTMAARTILGGRPEKIFEMSAEIAGNDRVENYYTDDSGTLDIWIGFSAFSGYNGFVTGGAYLSDIYQLGAISNGEFKKLAYYRLYKLPIDDND